jgi:hypothetical protein
VETSAGWIELCYEFAISPNSSDEIVFDVAMGGRIVQATGDAAVQDLVEAFTTPSSGRFFSAASIYNSVESSFGKKAKHFLDIFGIRVGVDKDDLIDNIDFEDMIENYKQVRVL